MKFTVYIARKGLFTQLPVPIQAPEAILWRAVLDRTLHDTASKNRRLRLESRQWFSLENPDFVEVCELALLSPEDIYKAYHTKLRHLIQRNKDKY